MQEISLEKYLANISSNPLASAFDSKFTIHAGNSGQAVARENYNKEFDSLLSGSSDECVIYIHTPFCQSKCTFCGFAGTGLDKAELEKYGSYLIKEIKLLGQSNYAKKTPVQAIYFGGGTPSALEPEYFKELLPILKDNFNLANDCEITLEGRVHDYEGQRGLDFIDAGFSRFSLGVQTFNTKIRKAVGRKSDGDKAMEIISMLTSQKKLAVIIDLIFGLPNQSIDDFMEDILKVSTLGVDGLDIYQLNVLKSTNLGKAIESGKDMNIAALSEQGEYYARAKEYFLTNKWKQLSLCHFSPNTREKNVYNAFMKSRKDCISIGAGAGGSINGYRFFRGTNLENYYKNLDSGIALPDMITAPVPHFKMITFIISQIEQGYLNLECIKNYNIAFYNVLMKLVKNWEEAKLVFIEKDYMNLTTAGMYWGVNLSQSILNVLSQIEEK